MQDENILLKIRRLTPYLNPALKRIAVYVLKQPEKVKSFKISELADQCRVSVGTVTRFVKEIGLKNFPELKIAIAEMSRDHIDDVNSEEKFVYDDVGHQDSTESIIEKIAFSNLNAIEITKKNINPREIEKAVAAIDKSNFIVIFGVGTSSIAAQNVKMRFYRVGKNCIVYNDPAQQAVSASLLDKNSVAIGISNSGKSMPTVLALKMAKETGATTICITNSDESPINKYADVKLYTSTRDSAFFQESMVSRIAQILVIDILYASYAVKIYRKSVKSVEKSAAAVRRMLYGKEQV